MIRVSAEEAALMAGAAIADGYCVVCIPSVQDDWHFGAVLAKLTGDETANTLHEVARLMLSLDDCALQAVTGRA